MFVSFFEIYGGKLFDLLGEKKCVILFLHSHILIAWLVPLVGRGGVFIPYGT